MEANTEEKIQPVVQTHESELFDGNQIMPQFALALKYFILNIVGSTSAIYGRSYLSANQGITTAFNTKVTFDTNDYATGVTWDGTNNRFTCLTAGKYLVASTLQWNSPTTNFSYNSKLYKNGAEVSRGSFIPGNFAGPASSSNCDIVTLAVGDYVEVFAFQGSGGTINVAGGSALSFLEIIKIA